MHVYEGADTPGGGCRTEELTLSGFAHDVCSTVHPLLAASPFFTEKPLAGLSLKTPDIAFAHPLDGGRAAAVSGSVEQTAIDARRRRARLPPHLREARQGHRRDRALGAGAPALSPGPSPGHGPLRLAWAVADDGARPPVQDRPRACAAGRVGRPFDATARGAWHRRVCAAARRACARGRLAGRGRRQRRASSRR